MDAERAPAIIVATACLQDVFRHACSSDNEMGGLLVGRAYSLPSTTQHGYDFVTIVNLAIPSLKLRHSRTSVLMAPDLWTRAGVYAQSGAIVVGWYHSHPGFGVFFSGIDRSTQASFFAHPYCLGLVVDPVAHKRRLFVGAECAEATFRIVPGAEMLGGALSIEGTEEPNPTSQVATVGDCEQPRVGTPDLLRNSRPKEILGVTGCRTCGSEVAQNATACPHCGEELPGLHVTCPRCKSTSLTTNRKGSVLGRAWAGIVRAGPVGTAAGLFGRGKPEMTCKRCGHKWVAKM